MMVCSKCGNELDGNTQFCPKCGTALGGDSSSNQQESTDFVPGKIAIFERYTITSQGIYKVIRTSTIEIAPKELHVLQYKAFLFKYGKKEYRINIADVNKILYKKGIILFGTPKLVLSCNGEKITILLGGKRTNMVKAEEMIRNLQLINPQIVFEK